MAHGSENRSRPGSEYRGQVVLVTGGGRGIGRAVALGAAERGARVAVVARTEAEVMQVSAEAGRRGEGALPLVGDVSSAEDVTRIVREVEQDLGPVDVLVNNAGVVARAAVAEMEEATWDAVVDVNLKGTFLCTRAVLPGMLERGRGRIVNVSSISGTLGTPLLSAYCASKWGVVGFTKAVAEEVKGSGVVVASVLPGSVDTGMLQEGLPGARPDMSAEEVAHVILYLGGTAPPAVTGSAVEVFG